MCKENENIEYSVSMKETFPFHYNEFNQDSIFKNKNIRYKVIKEKNSKNKAYNMQGSAKTLVLTNLMWSEMNDERLTC